MLEHSPVELRRLESANVTVFGWIWIWMINIFELSLAQFNVHDIYTVCERVTGHQSAVLEIRDVEQIERPFPSSSRFEMMINNGRDPRSQRSRKNKQAAFDSFLLLLERCYR